MLSWQQVVISLQTILGASPLVVGRRTALELQGYAHYLVQSTTAVYLYGSKAPPGWVGRLPLEVRFAYRNDRRLFARKLTAKSLGSPTWNINTGEAEEAASLKDDDITHLTWGQWDWPLTLSTPERAIFELLVEIPNHETFEQIDALFSGLSNLRPVRLQKLLTDCTSVKVKRLFFFFADRHRQAWCKHLDKEAIDFGSGKRLLVRCGVLDPAYQITVPKDLNGVR